MSETTQFIKAALVSELGEGQVLVVTVPGGRRVALCRADGKYYAIDDKCTHDNGPLGEGQLVGDQIECPRHGARFDIKTGKALCLPGVGRVATHPCEVRDG